MAIVIRVLIFLDFDGLKKNDGIVSTCSLYNEIIITL